MWFTAVAMLSAVEVVVCYGEGCRNIDVGEVAVVVIVAAMVGIRNGGSYEGGYDRIGSDCDDGGRDGGGFSDSNSGSGGDGDDGGDCDGGIGEIRF